MDKSPEAFRTISEVAEWLGVPTHVLRFWESRFTQVKPVKRAGGRRYYRPTDMALLGGIRKLLHEDGLTIRGVQKVLREQGVRHVAALSPPLGTAVEASRAAPVAAPEAEHAAPPEAGTGRPAAETALPDLPTPVVPEIEPAGPDLSLLRFPFADDAEAPADAPSDAPADAAATAPADAPSDAPAELPDPPAKSDPPAAAFLADVPDADPDDDDPDVAIPGIWPSLAGPGRAAQLAAHAGALATLHARAVALRDRMAARLDPG